MEELQERLRQAEADQQEAADAAAQLQLVSARVTACGARAAVTEAGQCRLLLRHRANICIWGATLTHRPKCQSTRAVSLNSVQGMFFQ